MTLHQCSQGQFKVDPKKYQLENLVWFFIRILRDTITDINRYRYRYVQMQKLSEAATTVYNCFKSSPEKRMKVSDIVAKTHLPRRTIQYALKKLAEFEFIHKLGQGAGTRYQLVF